MRAFLIWTARILGGVLATLLLIGIGCWAYLATGLPKIEGEVALPGLDRPVEILRDGDGVPHIFAETLDDASYALGFAHAQDRLFQMDFQRRLAAGRLAEVVGAMALPSDRIMRTLGIYALAEQTLTQLPPAMRKRVDAYSRGVNAYLETRSGALPIEYYALKIMAVIADPLDPANVEPEPWRGADSLVWGRLMALTLSGNARGEALRARLSSRLSSRQFADLFAEETEGAVTLPDPPNPARAELHTPVPAAHDRLFAAFMAVWPNLLGPTTASNAWVVDGGRTASGKPILANDPHLSFTTPGIWYLARLVTPEGDLTGATVPGVPFPILGHNGHVAWGMTTTTADTQDLFIETLLDGDRYQTPDGPAALTIRTESILVAGGPAVSLRVRATRHGPLLSDVDPNTAAAAPNAALAFAATALRPDDRSMEAVWRVGGARDVDEVRSALAHADAPMQNVFFADIKGNAGVMAAAKVPIRKSGDGFLPAIGATGAQDWTGWIPTEALPAGIPAPGGLLINANNRMVGPGYPYFISRDWDPSYRADRLEALLGNQKSDRIEDHLKAQQDNFSGMAKRLLPLMLPRLGPAPDLQTIAALLARWDYRMARDRPEPLIFAAWVRALGADLVGPALGDMSSVVGRNYAPLIERALRGNGVWCAIEPTPELRLCRDLTETALLKAREQLMTTYGKKITLWRWGDAHKARHAHLLFGRVPLLRDWFDITLPSDGGDDTVNRGAMARANAGNDPTGFTHVHGAGFRAVYDLSNLTQSQMMIATGQSGHRLSAHYRNLAQPWRDGESRSLGGGRAELNTRGAKTLVVRSP